jgi:hypothetical protein
LQSISCRCEGKAIKRLHSEFVRQRQRIGDQINTPWAVKRAGIVDGVFLTEQSSGRWSWGCVSAIDSNGRTIWVVDAHRDDGKRFVVRADEKLTAFLELETAIRDSLRLCLTSR